ncbi:MAG: archaeal proteasome endopeptidase complex subunit alpha [Nanoarchaeota archaeon]
MEAQNDTQNQMMGYDRAATMFSPEGHILQVEYAEKTVRLGSASMAIVCSDGVVMLADKRINDSLMVSESANKISEIDSHIIGCAAGILSDARILIERAQLLSQQHRVSYDSAIDVASIIKDLSDVKQQYTQHPGVRPFGIAIMVAGIDTKNHVYVSDVTGNYFEFYATAIGENDEKIKDALRKQYKHGMKIDDAIKMGLSIFKEIKGKNFNIENFDAAFVLKDEKEKKVQRLNGDKLKKFVK